MSKHLTPFAVVERIIGRPEVVGPAIGKTGKVGYLWRRPSKGRDAGDIPSARDMRALLAFARARGLPLMAQDLIFGADAADIDARLAQMNTVAVCVTVAEGADLSAPKCPTGGGHGAAPAPVLLSHPLRGGGRDKGAATGSGGPVAATVSATKLGAA